MTTPHSSSQATSSLSLNSTPTPFNTIAPGRRLPKDHIVTAFPPTRLMASYFPSNSSVRTPSSAASPRLASPSARQDSPTALKASPSSFIGHPPFALPETPVDSPPITPRAMGDLVAKAPRLIRRISRGAQNKLRGRRSSASSANGRDASTGPVIMRRRSDSRHAVDGGLDMSDVELDSDEELSDNMTFNSCADSLNGTPQGYDGRSRARSIDATLSPTVPSLLQRGTLLTKVTRKKKKDLIVWLDLESARIRWNFSKPGKSIYIDDIQSIRKGASASNYREDFQISHHYESRWFTIVYSVEERSKGRTIKLAHLIAPNDLFFDLWTTWLEAISRSRISLMAGVAKTGEKSMETLWNREMTKRGSPVEGMDIACARELCRNLQINCTDSALRAQFDKADEDRDGFLNFSQFRNFVRQLKERKDVKKVYEKAVQPLGQSFADPAVEGELDLEHFLIFLRDEQGINVDVDMPYWINVFERYARRPRLRSMESDATVQTVTSPGDCGSTSPLEQFNARVTMTIQGFQKYLTSLSNSVLVSRTQKPHLDKPLNEYFISSSHNTYLLGRQLAGESSTEAYIMALERGCRCVEIDCWNGPNGQPAVTHGRTLTKNVTFVDCIETIDKYAFAASNYPLIISLEVHCNAEQQERMAAIMRKVFRDKLVLEPLTAHSSYANVLPSPEQLKGKILIKVKATDPIEEATTILSELSLIGRGRSVSSLASRPIAGDNAVSDTSIISSPISASPSELSSGFWGSTCVPSGAEISPASSGEDSETASIAAPGEKKRKRKASNVVKPLSELGVYTRGYKFSDFKAPESKTFNHVFSLAEGTFNDFCNKSAQHKHAMEKHNTTHLMRVYPGMKRVTSDNFDPLIFWRRGVQMAALNWQTYDVGMQINEAMFAAGTDRTGYVLKPEELRSPYHQKKEKRLVKFSVDIISAQQLPRPRTFAPDAYLNPYVEFEMYSAEDKARGIASGQGGSDASARNGMSGIGFPLRKRTRIVERNGYDPAFDETISMTLETKYPSLVFVRWIVRSSQDGRTAKDSDGVLATFTAKLSSLQQGYRHLPLYSVNGEQYLFSTLFCRIKKEDHVDVAADAENPQPVKSSPATGGRGDFFKRLLSRTPSERKKAAPSRTTTGGSDWEKEKYNAVPRSCKVSGEN